MDVTSQMWSCLSKVAALKSCNAKNVRQLPCPGVNYCLHYVHTEQSMRPASLMLQTFLMFSVTTDSLLATGRPFHFCLLVSLDVC